MFAILVIIACVLFIIGLALDFWIFSHVVVPRTVCMHDAL